MRVGAMRDPRAAPNTGPNLMRLLILITIALLAPALQAAAHDAFDVLYVGRLDADDIPDTILGVETAELRMLPVAIAWGSTSRPSSTAPGREAGVTLTTLRYPSWERLTGSLTIEDVDADGVDDIALFYRSWSPSMRDSAHAIVLLGRAALRRPSIDLTGTEPGDRELIVDIARARLLQARAVRDLSGEASHAWGRLRSDPAEPPTSVPVESGTGWITVYPNPGATVARFEAGRLAAGEYRIEMIDIEGRVRASQQLTASTQQSVSGTFDIAELPPGSYLVRIRTGDATVVTHSMVVVR